jgi:hypothetical protein
MVGHGRRISTFFDSPPEVACADLNYDEGGTEAGLFSGGNPANLTLLDVACGMPLGCTGDPSPAPRRSSLNEFTSRLFSSSFGRGPCYMPFSGGRESSMWLALATQYARRHGHDDPVPLTLRYPGLASPEQLTLQELVVAQLRLADWERVEPDDDLDLIGPVAGAALWRTGPFWPPNAYTMAPLIEMARDGVFVLVTGLSDFFAWWRWAPLAGVLAGHRRPARRDATLLASMLVPVSARARAARRRVRPPLSWLQPAAERRAVALLTSRQAGVPVRFSRAATTQITHRCFTGAAGTFRALGDALGTTIELPLSRPGVVESLAGAGGWLGFGEQRSMLQRLAGDLLPSELLARRPAPDLNPIFFGEPSREFAANWTGAGLDESVVDVAALRRNWLSERPDPRTACLLQYAWLNEPFALGSSPPTSGELQVTQSNQRGSR